MIGAHGIECELCARHVFVSRKIVESGFETKSKQSRFALSLGSVDS